MELIPVYDLSRLYGEIDEHGDVYFVDPANGINAASRTGSRTQPFATVTYALTRCTANNHDIIHCLAGAYDENAAAAGITVNVNGVHIRGFKDAVFVNTNAGATRVFTVTADNIEISGMTIDEDTNTVDGIYIDATASHVDIHDIHGNNTMRYGVRVIANATDIHIHDNLFQGIVTGVYCNGTRVYMYHNRMIGATDNGIDFRNGAVNCIAYQNFIDGGDGTTQNGIGALNCGNNAIIENKIWSCIDGIDLPVSVTDFALHGNDISNCTRDIHIVGAGNQTETPTYRDTVTRTAAQGNGEVDIETVNISNTGRMAYQFDVNEIIVGEAATGIVVTFRAYHRIDAAADRLIAEVTFTEGVDTIHPTLEFWKAVGIENGLRITIQTSLAVTGDRDIPFVRMCL